MAPLASVSAPGRSATASIQHTSGTGPCQVAVEFASALAPEGPKTQPLSISHPGGTLWAKDVALEAVAASAPAGGAAAASASTLVSSTVEDMGKLLCRNSAFRHGRRDPATAARQN